MQRAYLHISGVFFVTLLKNACIVHIDLNYKTCSCYTTNLHKALNVIPLFPNIWTEYVLNRIITCTKVAKYNCMLTYITLL